MKSKSVDLEINEANDRDNNSNVNLITIAKSYKQDMLN